MRIQTLRWGISTAEVKEKLDRLSDDEINAIAKSLRHSCTPVQAEHDAAVETMYLLTALLLKDALMFARIVSVHAGGFSTDW